MPARLTTDVVEAVFDRPVANADGLTVRELAMEHGLDPDSVTVQMRLRDGLRRAIERGAWEVAGKSWRPQIDGSQRRQTVYRPVVKPKRAARKSSR